MKFANSENLVRCNWCDALYDKTLKWVRGYHHGTTTEFTTVSKVEPDSCPICRKDT